MYMLLSLIWSDACNKMVTINNATCSEGTEKYACPPPPLDSVTVRLQ